jgi:hypothetical protein
MARRLRKRFYTESALAGLSGVLGVLTIFWRDWIEGLTGFDPDRHNGTVEWLVVAGLLAVAITSGLVARLEWRRAAERLATGPAA